MKVLVADKLEDSARRGLAEIGCEVVYEPDRDGDTLVEAVKQTQADVLVVRSTKVTRAMLEAGKISLVVRAGAGTNTIDVEAASERGIWVANCPGKNAIAVAELAMGMILALDRRIVDATADLKSGRWEKAKYKAALALKPSLVKASQNLASIYLEDPPRPDDAIPLLRKALEVDPSDPIILENIAYAYGLKKDVEKASKAYELALQKDDTFKVLFQPALAG